MDGFWTGRGAPSVVDWCEPNYVVTPYVAEFWNTVSSLPMAVMGVLGLVWCWRERAHLPRRYAGCFLGLAAVGIGSAAFHGTLLRVSQGLDELPMVYVGLLGAWVLRYRDRPRHEGRGVALAMLAYAVVFTGAYATSESYFHIFLASYSLLVAYVAIGSMVVTWVRGGSVLRSRLLMAAAVGYLGSMAFFWIPEHLLLGCDHPLQQAHLHSLWHLGAGTGTYAWFLWAIVDRWQAHGQEAQWRGFFVRAA